MGIPVYDPDIDIKLFKVVNRTEIAKGIRTNDRMDELIEIQLDLFLGDGCSVRVSKGVKEPAGTFVLTFIDREVEDLDSIYGLVEPMDLVEIRMAHHQWDKEAGYHLPIAMRGFVTELRRVEGIGEDGKPERRVIVSGHDYGKIFQIYQIVYINNAAVGDNILHSFPFSMKYNIDATSAPSCSQFVADTVKSLKKKFFDKVVWKDSHGVKPFATLTPLCSSVGTISNHQVNSWPGGDSIYALIAKVCDISNGFNEFFTIDRENDVGVVLRPTPYVTPDGKLIAPADREKDWYPDEVTITNDDIVSVTTSRSDSNVANFFWVRNPSFTYSNDMALRLMDQASPISDVQNCNPFLYGIRMMEATIYLGAPRNNAGESPSEAKMKEVSVTEEEWRKKHQEILRKIGQDAVVFESGTMRLKGNEKIRAGGFLNIVRNGVKSRCYVEQVEQEFLPYHGMFTTVRFRQGTGFIERSQYEKPYRMELTVSGAYGDRNA